jgi:preprotein translocase subunit SecB
MVGREFSRFARIPKLKAFEALKPTLNPFALNSVLPQGPKGAEGEVAPRHCSPGRSLLANARRGASSMAKNKAKGDQPKKTNGDGPSEAPPPEAPEAKTPAQPQLTVLAQYIKDLSFESPGAPQSLQGPGQNPQLKVSVNVNAGPRGDDAYEVALQLEVHARSDQGVIYNVELVYGGLFRLRGVPQNLLQPVLFVDCPTILFPFMRRVLADVIRDGGFPPLMLDPIDFGRLYAQNLAQSQGAAKN